MTITFRLPPNAVECVAFAYSPLLEAVLSLHVVVEPKHHPLQHPWVRRMQSLPPSIKREIRSLDFAYRTYFPAYLFPSAAGEPKTFEDELNDLGAVPPEAIEEEFGVALVGAVARGGIARRRRALRDVARSGTSSEADAARLILNEPGQVLGRLVSLLATYWEEVFADEWRRIEPDLAESVTEAGRAIAENGLFDLLRRCGPDIRANESDQCFWLERPHDHVVAISEDVTLTLVPSAYVWPHVHVNCDQPWPYALVFPASFLLREARPAPAPGELRSLFRTLSDATRLRALRLIAIRPRSTEELAPLLDITPAALSKHLRQLAEAGLVTAQREGYYVLYDAERDRIAEVGRALQSFILDSHDEGDAVD